MAASNITVSGLTATGAVGAVVLAWTQPVDPNASGLPYLQLDAIEVFAHTINNRNDVALTKIGEQRGTTFVHSGLSRGASRYYWLRPRDKSGLYGEWHPISPTGGVRGTEVNNDAQLLETGFFQNPNGLLEQWGFTSQFTGSQIVHFPRRFSQLFGVVATPYSNTRTDLQFVVNLGALDLDRITIRLTALSNGIPVDSDAVVWWRATGMP